MNKPNKAIVKVEEFMSQLPSEFLLTDVLRVYGRVTPLVHKWLEMRGAAQDLGKNLKARFGGGGGNPAYQAWKAGKIDELDYKFLTSIVDYHEALFAVIQLGWGYIEEDLCCLDTYPKTETAFYFEILREQYDGTFQRYLKGCKLTVKMYEDEAKLFCTGVASLATVPDPRWILKLTPEQRQKLKVQKTGDPKTFWLPLALRICYQNAPTDDPLKRKLRELSQKLAYMAQLMAVAAQQERSPNPPRRLRSEKWKNGRLYEGTTARISHKYMKNRGQKLPECRLQGTSSVFVK